MSGRLIGPNAVIALSATSRTTWIQLIRCGDFVSERYGKFAITSNDLRTMISNFRDVTPIPPTQLPIDYDHLSMDPKAPGDGKAAGWIQDLQLRNADRELWARVEFTEPAAQAIRAKEYRFVSPSFVRDYVAKNGAKVGATLLAAAVTNLPFLEGMAAMTLSAIAESRTTMKVGQRVVVRANAVRSYVIDPALVGQPLTVAEIRGEVSRFARLEHEGRSLGWFAEQDLEAAPATSPALANAVADVLLAAKQKQLANPGMDLRRALHLVGVEQPATVSRYVDAGREVTTAAAQQANAGSRLAVLAKARAAEKQIEYSDAVREVIAEQPALYEAWRANQSGRYTTR